MASYHVKTDRSRHRASNQKANQRFARGGRIVLISLLSFATCALTSCGNKAGNVAGSPAAEPVGTNAPSPPAAARPEHAKLVGKWERPDGGYILEIRSVDGSGVIEAGYFNPDPIRVSRALAFQKDGGVKVFIELRDVNYPGCTYSLSYDPQSDQLYGQYYQAAMDQTYDITFARVK